MEPDLLTGDLTWTVSGSHRIKAKAAYGENAESSGREFDATRVTSNPSPSP